MSEAPAGFARHTRRSGLTDPWEPIYARQTDQALILALRAAEPHCNSRSFVHGGLISALADNAMGLSCRGALTRLGKDAGMTGLVTVSLVVDFLETAHAGQWLAFETDFVRAGGSLCFAQCRVTADDAVCARAQAHFRVLRTHSPSIPAANT